MNYDYNVKLAITTLSSCANEDTKKLTIPLLRHAQVNEELALVIDKRGRVQID